jgi:hypothetical protein
MSDIDVLERIDADLVRVLMRWQIDLKERIGRRRLLMELVNANIAIDDLVAEKEQFKRVMRAWKWGDK